MQHRPVLFAAFYHDHHRTDRLRQMRSDITEKINRLPMGFYNKTSHGDILSRVTNDVDMISQSLNQSVGMLVSAITLFLASLLMMLLTNVLMTLTAIVAIFIGFMLMRLITAHSQKYFARQQRHLGELNGHIEEMYSGHTVIKAYNGEAHAQKTFDDLNGTLKDSAFKAPVPCRADAANDGFHRQPRLRRRLRHRSGAHHERTDRLRGHRRLHDVRPFLHAAALPDRAGSPDLTVRCRRRRTCL